MGDDKRKPRRFWIAVGSSVAVVLTGIAIAFFTPLVTALGNRLAETTGVDQLVSASDEQAFICWGGTFFVPNDTPDSFIPSDDILPGDFGATDDCDDTLASMGGVPTDNSIVASITAETDDPVTITGIDVINVKQDPIPSGTYVTPAQVGGYYPSKYVFLDLDQTPISPIDIGEYVNGEGGSYITPDSIGIGTSPLTDADLLRIPWQVTKAEPLQLFVLTKGTRYDATFSVRLTWMSGDRKGEIVLDGDGGGYRSIGSSPELMAGNWVVTDLNGAWMRATS